MPESDARSVREPLFSSLLALPRLPEDDKGRWGAKSKHWFKTSFLQGRCRKAVFGVWREEWQGVGGGGGGGSGKKGNQPGPGKFHKGLITSPVCWFDLSVLQTGGAAPIRLLAKTSHVGSLRGCEKRDTSPSLGWRCV